MISFNWSNISTILTFLIKHILPTFPHLKGGFGTHRRWSMYTVLNLLSLLVLLMILLGLLLLLLLSSHLLVLDILQRVLSACSCRVPPLRARSGRLNRLRVARSGHQCVHCAQTVIVRSDRRVTGGYCHAGHGRTRKTAGHLVGEELLSSHRGSRTVATSHCLVDSCLGLLLLVLLLLDLGWRVLEVRKWKLFFNRFMSYRHKGLLELSYRTFRNYKTSPNDIEIYCFKF